MDVSMARSKIKTVGEVVTVWAATIGLFWLEDWFPAVAQWQKTHFVKEIGTVVLGLGILPTIAILLMGSDGRSNIFRKKYLRRSMKIAGKSMSVMMPVTFLSFPVVGFLGFSFTGWYGGLIIAWWHLLAIPALCYIFKPFDQVKDNGISRRDLGTFYLLLLVSALLVWALKYVHPKASEVVISLVFIGLLEDFMFREYIQGRLNQVFGKPWQWLNCNFGWGLIIAAVLFGAAHFFNSSNPFNLPWGIWTFVAGVGSGIIREKGYSFLASGTIHGIIMVFPVFFSA